MQRTSIMRDPQLTGTARSSDAYDLRIMQQPEEGRAAGKSDKARGTKWPIDPPPVIEFMVNDNDKSRAFLHSPFWFCTAELEAPHSSRSTPPPQSSLLNGCLVSSLHKVKLSDNKEHGLFIFGDLNAKIPGFFQLRFTLYEMRQGPSGWHAAKLSEVCSKKFKIFLPKEHASAPQRESTSLSRTLCEAGVKLRIRKESSKRKAQSAEWAATKQQAIQHSMLPPPGSMGPPASRWPRDLQYGESIMSRLTFGKPQDLGIRQMLDNQAMAAVRPNVSRPGQGITGYAITTPPTLSRAATADTLEIASAMSHLRQQPQRYDGTPQLSRFDSTSTYDSPRTPTSPQHSRLGNIADYPTGISGGYVPPQNNSLAYGTSHYAATQYSSEQLASLMNGGNRLQNLAQVSGPLIDTVPARSGPDGHFPSNTTTDTRRLYMSVEQNTVSGQQGQSHDRIPPYPYQHQQLPQPQLSTPYGQDAQRNFHQPLHSAAQVQSQLPDYHQPQVSDQAEERLAPYNSLQTSADQASGSSGGVYGTGVYSGPLGGPTLNAGAYGQYSDVSGAQMQPTYDATQYQRYARP